MDQRVTQLSTILLRVMNKIVRNEKTPRRFGSDILLHPSEIHTIMFIGDHEGVHLSELARIMGVTRGAVSQSVAKLEKKGLVAKTGDPSNNLKMVPALTKMGRVAYWAHEQHHEEMDADLFDFIKRLSEEQVAVIEDFLGHIEQMADKNR